MISEAACQDCNDGGDLAVATASVSLNRNSDLASRMAESTVQTTVTTTTTTDVWIEQKVFLVFRLWHMIFLSTAGFLAFVILLCCCFKCRIPRTKQEIESDFRRNKVTRKFRRELNKMQMDDVDIGDIKGVLDKVREKFHRKSSLPVVMTMTNEKAEAASAASAPTTKRTSLVRIFTVSGKRAPPSSQTTVAAVSPPPPAPPPPPPLPVPTKAEVVVSNGGAIEPSERIRDINEKKERKLPGKEIETEKVVGTEEESRPETETENEPKESDGRRRKEREKREKQEKREMEKVERERKEMEKKEREREARDVKEREKREKSEREKKEKEDKEREKKEKKERQKKEKEKEKEKKVKGNVKDKEAATMATEPGG